MPERRAFVENALAAAQVDLAMWRQVRETWTSILESARLTKDVAREKAAEAQIRMCAQHITSFEATVQELEARLLEPFPDLDTGASIAP